jgi:hypothetical protein
MKRWIGLAFLVFIGAAGWRIGSALSPDALSMAVGVLFGVMAGVPAALLVMAGSRRRSSEERSESQSQREHTRQPVSMNGPVTPWGMPYAQQPPIIVVAAPPGLGNAPQPGYGAGYDPGYNSGYNSGYNNARWFPQEPPARQFTVIGNGEELSEDW